MDRRRQLRRGVIVLFLTLLMLAAVTLAWFINWMTPFTDAFRFASPSLSVNVTITDQDGNPLPSKDGNAIMRAENMKPGDTLTYLVSIQNNGGACRVYLGLSDVKNYRRDHAGTEYGQIPADSAEDCLSDALRLSILKKAEGSGIYEEQAYRFLGRDKEFFFDRNFSLKSGETLELQYRVQFVAEGEGPEAQTGTGAAAGNSFTLLKTEGLFSVSTTLAQ